MSENLGGRASDAFNQKFPELIQSKQKRFQFKLISEGISILTAGLASSLASSNPSQYSQQ